VRIAGAPAGAFDVVRLGRKGEQISLLAYPRFFDDAFPALERSWAVDLRAETAACREYGRQGNPPILHRKELLLAPGHPERATFAALTEALEGIGLFENASEIGTRNAWASRLERAGVQIEGHTVQIVPRKDEADVEISRHRTALTRYALSTPMQLLWRHGYLDGGHSVFDYGCGRGDDISALRGRGIAVGGWDPHFAPAEPRTEADVVNLGFVLNVIEDPAERSTAVRAAFALAKRVLAVAVLIGGRSVFEKYRLFRDGVLTQRGTFQKYYTQAEIRDYLAAELGREPVALAPGVFFVFPDDEEEQRFLERRQRSTLLLSALPTVPRERAVRVPREPRAAKPKPPTKWEAHAELLEAFYGRTLELGRIPEPDEFERLAEVREHLGLPVTVLNRIVRERGTEGLAAAQDARRRDLLVYLALNLFERRRSFGHLPERTRRDVRALWGNYGTAQTEAQSLLFSVGKVDVVHAACREAAERGLGRLEADHDLQIHTSLVTALPPVLRVYLGCAARLYGEVDSADLVKVHIQSGKLTLMTYDDFEGKAVPALIERVKIDMRRQDIYFFEYGPDQPQALYLKSRYMHPSMDGYAEQAAFDAKLGALGLFDFAEFGPPVAEFDAGLERAKLRIKGFDLVRRRAPRAAT
jgi:DNA phosphorothioation-associated putative methyltransferase